MSEADDNELYEMANVAGLLTPSVLRGQRDRPLMPWTMNSRDAEPDRAIIAAIDGMTTAAQRSSPQHISNIG